MSQRDFRLMAWGLLIATGSIFMTGCAEEAKPPKQDNANKKAEEAEKFNPQEANRARTVKRIFQALPNPMSTASILRKAGAMYDKGLLNPESNISKYETTKRKALNLGIYGADLSYSGIFEKTNECRNYIKATKQLSEELGIAAAFNNSIIQRFEDNVHEKDSVLQILSDSYWTASTNLKESHSGNVLALIIAGGWIEGLYISTQLIKNNDNDEIRTRIAEQKGILNNLVSLIEGYEGDDMLSETHNDLLELKKVYDGMDIVKTAGENTVDDSGVMTIGGKREISMTDEQLASVTKLVDSIRSKYID